MKERLLINHRDTAQAQEIQEHEEASLHSSLALVVPCLSRILGNSNTWSDPVETFLSFCFVCTFLENLCDMSMNLTSEKKKRQIKCQLSYYELFSALQKGRGFLCK